MFRLSLQAVGVFLCVQGLAWLPILGGTIWDWFTAHPNQWIPSADSVADVMNDCLYLMALWGSGLYLLFGGKLLLALAIRPVLTSPVSLQRKRSNLP